MAEGLSAPPIASVLLSMFEGKLGAQIETFSAAYEVSVPDFYVMRPADAEAIAKLSKSVKRCYSRRKLEWIGR